ncbi:hypothetical protein CCH79_00000556 [Gambusia affinis]|uniref:KASH domain-containing protein n=1 Tax=Gambusia affinis TaxID=33528 RepID=A0A315VX81_GAMAF|nr:hypothetical protein CCH79_00000556 [Gambusia affinis]
MMDEKRSVCRSVAEPEDFSTDKVSHSSLRDSKRSSTDAASWSMRAKIGEVDASSNIPSADLQKGQRENLQQTLLKLVEAERCCGALQRAASQLEGRVAELDHWSSEALDCYDQLMERKPRGEQSAAKVLISRGLLLAQQVVAESQHLEAFVAEQQKTSPLQTFSTADTQDRIAAAISQSQASWADEILDKFSSCGFKQQVGDFCERMQPVESLHADTGSYVLARTKQIVDVKLQTPELIQLPDQGARRRHDSKRSTEDRKGSASHEKMKTIPQPVMVPVQTESPAAGSTEIKSRTASQPNTTQGQTHTQPPLMIHSEVHRKAQSMARSRLEKARLRLQGRIQQAMKLFGGREMTESQIKKKQKALNTLQPAVLDEFLGAAEAFGAFCSGPQLQDLLLLSESVRNQAGEIWFWAISSPTISRMVPLKSTSDPMESADSQATIITEKLNQIIRQPLDVSSLALDESSLFSDLKEMDETLKDEMRRLEEEEQRGPGATSQPFLRQSLLLCNVRHLEQLRQQLDGVQSAVETLDHFLATLRDIKAESPTLLANRDPNDRKNETELQRERHSWQAAVESLNPVMEQSHIVDCSLKAAGMTLTMDGASVTCRDVAAFLSDQMRAKRQEGEKELDILEKIGVQRSKDVEEPRFAPTVTEEESTLEVKKRKQEPKIQILRSEEGFLQRSLSSHAGKAGNEHKGLVQRKSALLAVLKETKAAAERLELLEPTLPALQQRTRALTELESFLASLDSEVQYVHDASSKSDFPKENPSREVEDLWEETRKATSERLEQAQALTELLRRFQIMRAELDGTLQKAEATIAQQASYIGKDFLQRLYAKVGETKAELNGLGDDIEEVRSVCRQLQSLLRQVPGCSGSPFENEADALMDRWLDLSERTDSQLENLHLCLMLWDGVLQLGEEVETWTNSRTAALSQGPSFQTEDDIKALQNEIMTQEESIRRFHRKAAEIQSLLQSAEPPPELQVVETQMRKKIEQLKELFLESEEVYKQTVATMGQITERMAESLCSLQKIQDSLHSFSGPDVATVLAKLKELCRRLHTEDEQAQSLLEDVQVLSSIAGPGSLQSLSVRGIELEEKLRNTHQLFSEVEEQTERNVHHLDSLCIKAYGLCRLQAEKEQLEEWLCAAEEDAPKMKNLSFLQEEALQQRGRTERIAELVSSLRSSNLQQCVLLQQSCDLLQRCHNFCTKLGGVSEEATPTPSNDSEPFQGLVESIQSWFDGLRQRDGGEIESSAEQRLCHAQAVLKATTGAETLLEQLRVTGESLSQRLSPELKRDVQLKIQKTQQHWKNLLESVQPYFRALEDDLELSSAYLTSRQEASCRVEELKHQAEQLPSLFPWPGSAERAQACLLARQLQAESESLKLTLISLDEKRRELAEKTRNPIWKDSSWDELETRWSALMAEVKGSLSLRCLVCLKCPQGLCAHLQKGLSNEEQFGQLLQACHHHLTTLQQRMTACQTRTESSGGLTSDAAALEALPKQVAEIEKELLVLVTLRDSLTASCTAEARASLSEQVSNLHNHKRAIERAIPLQEEVSLLQADLRDLAKNVKELSVLPDVLQLTQQWRSVQGWDKKLTQLDIRANGLQRTRETQEVPPAETIFTVSAVRKELLRYIVSVYDSK